MTDPTLFGYERVTPDEKSRRVRGVFDSVAGKYDLMNDLMSAGMHRGWKRFAVEVAGIRTGARVLDLAGGTGDLARLFAKRADPTGIVGSEPQSARGRSPVPSRSLPAAVVVEVADHDLAGPLHSRDRADEDSARSLEEAPFSVVEQDLNRVRVERPVVRARYDNVRESIPVQVGRVEGRDRLASVSKPR